MNVYDYLKVVSGYIINKCESKKDINQSINFTIKPYRDPHTKELFYEVSEEDWYKNQMFYMKFPCANKVDFYDSVNELLIECIKNSNLLLYSATNKNYLQSKFSIVTKKRVNISFIMEDEKDELVFNKFKNYLDSHLKNNFSLESVEIPKKITKVYTSKK